MNLGKVVAIHPESHSVDLLMLDDGRQMAGVMVMSSAAAAGSGVAGLRAPDSQGADDPFAASADNKSDIIAVVDFYRDAPVVLGFLFPQVAQVLFSDIDRYINRTPSDAYWTVDGRANTEFFHPSGAFMRIGTAPTHENLEGKDYDAVFKLTRNLDKKVFIHIEQAKGAASIDIDPDGKILIKTKKTITVEAMGAATIKAPTLTLDVPESTFKGNVTIKGDVTSTGNVMVSGDVSSEVVSLNKHVHGGVRSGGSDTEKAK